MQVIMRFKSDNQCSEFRRLVAQNCPSISYTGTGIKGEYEVIVKGNELHLFEMFMVFGKNNFRPSWMDVEISDQ
jgi:hypothetical protein